MNEGIGDVFQQETRYVRGKMPLGGLNMLTRPDVYKEYRDKRQIPLPPPSSRSAISVDEALRRRKSVRHFSSQPLRIEDLSYLLWASTGLQGRGQEGYEFRTAPSAGALYPIETYLIVNDVGGLPQGVYHYSIRFHLLEELQSGDFSQSAALAALGQRLCIDATALFVWTAIFQRSKWKYKQRAYRYIYLDAGHIAENLALAATSLEIGACHIGAIYDDEVNRILGVDGLDESALYMTAVGWPASEDRGATTGHD